MSDYVKGTDVSMLDPIDSRPGDALRAAAATHACNNLLRAHLRSGQHLLSYDLAVSVAKKIGMPADSVRAAAGDLTIITKGASRHG